MSLFLHVSRNATSCHGYVSGRGSSSSLIIPSSRRKAVSSSQNTPNSCFCRYSISSSVRITFGAICNQEVRKMNQLMRKVIIVLHDMWSSNTTCISRIICLVSLHCIHAGSNPLGLDVRKPRSACRWVMWIPFEIFEPLVTKPTKWPVCPAKT